MKAAIVGCGNMGMAFAGAFLRYELLEKDHLLLIEKDRERAKTLSEEAQGVVIRTIDEGIADCDLVMVAVKPQDFPSVVPELKAHLQLGQVVLSIMAGVSIASITTRLEHKEVVRAMPNTPALLRMGMTAFSAAEAIDRKQLLMVEELINATGESLYLEDENLLDAVTATSGSGPAYFFYFLKYLVQGAKELGLSEKQGRELAMQTMHGSYNLLLHSGKSLDELIANVSSKGGTTEAALEVFSEEHLGESLKRGMQAARDRARELSG